jgi:hypothetical protein
MLSFYTQTFLAPAEEVFIYRLKILSRNILKFPTNVFIQSFFRSRVTAVNVVLQTTPEEKNHTDHFSSVSTRRLCFVFLSVKSPVVQVIHQIMNCLSAGNSFITKFSPTLSSRSVFHIGVIQKYALL